MRLDVYLVEKGLCATRQKAVYCIREGQVLLNGRPCKKPGADTQGKQVVLQAEAYSYVSRGGLKLAGALRAFDLHPSGLVCLDLGASTGGFTDCLLESGAKRVYALDVGRDQLHERLRNDPRVISMEQFNARELCEESLPEKIAFAVSDLSFISQGLIYRPLSLVLLPGAPFVSLIKPQFEAGRACLSKKGIVTDARDHFRVICDLRQKAFEAGFTMEKICRSPIEGGDGNIEYTALFRFEKGRVLSDGEIHTAVYGGAHPV